MRGPLVRLSLVLVPALFTGLMFSSRAAAAATCDGDAATGPRVVQLTLGGDVSEDPTPDNPFGDSQRNFRGKLLLLRQIAADPTVAAVELEIKATPDLAHAIDLLAELRAVQASGKKIVCYAETLGQKDLVFASLADLLVVPPSGQLGFEGLQAELMYLKDLLDKVHVSIEVLHCGNYKTAYEDYARATMSDEQRETIGALLDEYWNQMLDTIAGNRHVDRSVVEEMAKQVLVDPQTALDARMIDAVGFRSDFDARVETLLGGKPEKVENYGGQSAEDLEKMFGNPFAAFALIPKLLNPPKKELPKEPCVAIVYATGVIQSGKSQAGWDGKVTAMGSDTIVEALDTVLKDDNVKAVVLRVNSPGGSALASDMIWQAIQRLKAAHKPVISSMGNVAGSGGYWISMGCTAIVAQPCTITGSMGVVSMLPNLSDALKTLGVNVEVVARGPHGDQLSLLKNGPTPILRQVITTMMEKVYQDFITKAAEGRHLDRSRVEELARGRVWTGRQAADLGLVDELGGLQDAINLACTMAGGLPPSTTPIAEFPSPPNPFEQLQEMFGGNATLTGGASSAFASLAAALGPALGADLAVAFAGVPALQQLLPSVAAALANTDPLSADRVQCVMPFAITIH